MSHPASLLVPLCQNALAIVGSVETCQKRLTIALQQDPFLLCNVTCVEAVA